MRPNIAEVLSVIEATRINQDAFNLIHPFLGKSPFVHGNNAMADKKTLFGIALAEPLISQPVILLPQPGANTLMPRLSDVDCLWRSL